MTDAAGSRQVLGRKQRLIPSALFREAYDQGRRQFGRAMVLWLRAGAGAALRLGVVTGRKVGGAVQRNRARRRLREAFRRNRRRFAGPWDVVLVARRAALDASWDDLSAELLSLARKAGLMGGEDAKSGG